MVNIWKNILGIFSLKGFALPTRWPCIFARSEGVGWNAYKPYGNSNRGAEVSSCFISANILLETENRLCQIK